jgi:hypothetical protein
MTAWRGWKALQVSGIYERRGCLTEVYLNDLACEVRGLGYEAESQRNAKGVDNGFEIRVCHETPWTATRGVVDSATRRSVSLRRSMVDHPRTMRSRCSSSNHVPMISDNQNSRSIE